MMELENLQKIVIRCRKCPRLAAHREAVTQHRPRRFQDWDYWARPLPSFGDAAARVLIVGLAPAAQGGNRTGRMFTGDRSGEWLFEALYRFGFANRPASDRSDDGFALRNAYITATIRCAPPENKPLPEEIENCRPYFLKELDLLRNVKEMVTLGQVAFTQTVKSLKMQGMEIPALAFGHGKRYLFPNGLTLIASYHPSQRNTQTGKLTRGMFHQVFKRVRQGLEGRR
jgi:uracil-DNA glycosylase family 4